MGIDININIFLILLRNYIENLKDMRAMHALGFKGSRVFRLLMFGYGGRESGNGNEVE